MIKKGKEVPSFTSTKEKTILFAFNSGLLLYLSFLSFCITISRFLLLFLFFFNRSSIRIKGLQESLWSCFILFGWIWVSFVFAFLLLLFNLFKSFKCCIISCGIFRRVNYKLISIIPNRIK